MYRAVTWAALDRGIAIADEPAVTHLAETLRDRYRGAHRSADGRQYTVLADGVDITWKIREPEVNRDVSPVSAYSRRAGRTDGSTASHRPAGRRRHGRARHR